MEVGYFAGGCYVCCYATAGKSVLSLFGCLCTMSKVKIVHFYSSVSRPCSIDFSILVSYHTAFVIRALL